MTEEELEQQTQHWITLGGFFQRFSGEDHACLPVPAWRALLTLWLALAPDDEPRTGYLSPDYCKGFADGQAALRPTDAEVGRVLPGNGFLAEIPKGLPPGTKIYAPSPHIPKT